MNTKQPALSQAVSASDIRQVEMLLGREPRGLVAIPVRSSSSEPVVIQVASLVDDKPFPTLYWLVDKRLSYAIDQLEASGKIAELQTQIDQSAELQERMVNDHQAHIALRQSLMSAEQKQAIQKLGFEKVYEKRGIGGIENFTRIRCLHTYYAAHLVVANTVGEQLEQYWQRQNICFSHLHNR
jgi:hypothetical protein